MSRSRSRSRSKGLDPGSPADVRLDWRSGDLPTTSWLSPAVAAVLRAELEGGTTLDAIVRRGCSRLRAERGSAGRRAT